MASAASGPERFSCKSHEVTDGLMRVSLGGEIGRSDAEALDEALRAARAAAAIVILDVRATAPRLAAALETGRRSMLLDLRERFACMIPRTRLAG